jgi:hypothetical protein
MGTGRVNSAVCFRNCKENCGDDPLISSTFFFHAAVFFSPAPLHPSLLLEIALYPGDDLATGPCPGDEVFAWREREQLSEFQRSGSAGDCRAIEAIRVGYVGTSLLACVNGPDQNSIHRAGSIDGSRSGGNCTAAEFLGHINLFDPRESLTGTTAVLNTNKEIPEKCMQWPSGMRLR